MNTGVLLDFVKKTAPTTEIIAITGIPIFIQKPDKEKILVDEREKQDSYKISCDVYF